MTEAFAQRYRAEMDIRGYSQRSLGEMVGLNHSAISGMLRGKRSATADVAQKLAMIVPDSRRAEIILLAHGHSVADVEQMLGHHVATPGEIRSARIVRGAPVYDIPRERRA